MAIELNHTIIWSRDRRASAEFWADILGLEVGKEVHPFIQVKTHNSVDLDFATVPNDDEISPQHYAFLVSEEEFDHGFARLLELGLEYFADPAAQQPGQINHHDGGRGVYFHDPSGHNLELITQPYSAFAD